MTLARTRSRYMCYVVGFMINSTTRQILFIEKQRPDFQKGKWNGVGGKIEPGEEPVDAMVREFREETSAVTDPRDWEHTITLKGADFVVYFFRTFVATFPPITQTTDEALGFYFLKSIYEDLPVLDNMRWTLPMQFIHGLEFPVQVVWDGL